MAAPLWSRIDSGLGAIVAPNGQIAQANAFGDSVWIRVLNADGATRWTANWDLKTTRRLWVKALAPTSDAGWILAMDTANGKGSWLVRLDSVGRQAGSPMGMRHAESYGLFVTEAPSGGTWVAPSAQDSNPSTLYRFDSLGRFQDSTPLVADGSLSGIRVLSGKLVTWHNQSARRIHHFRLYGPRAQSAKDSLAILDYDTLVEATYAALLRGGRDSVGVERLVFATDSGKMDVVAGTMPRVRMVSWIVSGDKLQRQLDATNDLVFPAAHWIGADGKVRVAGTRRTAESVGGTAKFEPAVVELDDNFRQTRIWSVHPDGAPTVGALGVFAGSFPDGSGYVGVNGYENPTSITMLDRDGDSSHTLSLATTYSSNVWYGQPGGRLVNLGQSFDGRTRSIESWNTAANTSVRHRQRTYSSLQTAGGRLVLELERPASSGRLEHLGLDGRILSTRAVGPLAAGRHFLDLEPTSHTALVRLRLDGRVLVAKTAGRMR
jgi:hypothetical protein